MRWKFQLAYFIIIHWTHVLSYHTELHIIYNYNKTFFNSKLLSLNKILHRITTNRKRHSYKCSNKTTSHTYSISSVKSWPLLLWNPRTSISFYHIPWTYLTNNFCQDSLILFFALSPLDTFSTPGYMKTL